MFIRTKDRIYEIESDYLNNKGVRVGYNVVGQEEVVLIENNNIIQADSIEDLCDSIVVVPQKQKPFELSTSILNDSLWREAMKKRMEQEGYEFYLSIWNGEHNLVKVAEIKPSLEVKLINDCI